MHKLKGYTVILICIILLSSLFIGCGQKPLEVFEQFSNNGDVTVEQYNKLSDKNKEIVNKTIKDKLDKAYEDNTDNNTMQQTIDIYKDVSSLKDYLQGMRDKSYFRMIYTKAEDSISKKSGLENMNRFDLEGLTKEYVLIKSTSEYYDDSLKKIELIKKELPRADKEYIKESKEKYGVELPQTYFDENDIKKGGTKTETIKKEPQIGMTKSDVLASSWGKPKDINKTTTKYSAHEQWVYGGNRYLYFDDNELTAIQN